MTTTTTSRVYGTGDKATVECPYCGNEQKADITFITHPFVVLCDTEETQGCDRWFVVEVKFWATMTATAICDGKESE